MIWQTNTLELIKNMKVYKENWDNKQVLKWDKLKELKTNMNQNWIELRTNYHIIKMKKQDKESNWNKNSKNKRLKLKNFLNN